MTNNFLRQFIARSATRLHHHLGNHHYPCLILCASRSGAASPRPAIPHKTKVHYSAELQRLMCPMLTMPHIENRAVAQMRMTPRKKPLSEIVCLVDDDPLALRSTGFKHVLIGTTAKQVMRRANRSVLVVPSHPGLRKMSNQKNGTRLMERLIP